MDGDPEKQSAAVEKSAVPDTGLESSPAMTSGEKSRDANNEISGSGSRSGSGSGSTVSNNDDSTNLKKLDSTVGVPPPKEADLDAALAHLPEQERAILKEQLDIPDVKVKYITLFRYATKADLLVLFVAAFGAIAGGAILPLFTVRFLDFHFLSLSLISLYFTLFLLLFVFQLLSLLPARVRLK